MDTAYLLKKLLVAEGVLISIYIVILRWFENHYDPSATIFTGLVLPWDHDPDSLQPVPHTDSSVDAYRRLRLPTVLGSKALVPRAHVPSI